jgi:hypothetical protein
VRVAGGMGCLINGLVISERETRRPTSIYDREHSSNRKGSHNLIPEELIVVKVFIVRMIILGMFQNAKLMWLCGCVFVCLSPITDTRVAHL